jgi:hypothetical protein
MNMKYAGQISIDLLLTLIILLIMISSMTIIINQIKENHEIIALDNELKLLTNQYSNIINTTQIMNDYNYKIRIKMQNVAFQNEIFNVELKEDNGKWFFGIEEKERFFEMNILNDNFEQENGYLVIKNE